MSYLQKFRDNSTTQSVNHHFKLAFNKKLILVLLIVLAIPLTVYLSLQTQDVENHAAAPNQRESRGYLIEFKDPPLVDTESSGVGIAASRPTEDRRVDIEGQHLVAKKNILSVLGRAEYTSESPSAGQVRVLGEYENAFNGVALDISREEAEKLKASSPYVKAIYPNLVVRGALMDSVPLISANKVWGVKDSRGLNITGKNINVAVIDSGVDYTHSDLGHSASGQVFNSKVNAGYDFINDDPDPMDDAGHGTHVASIIAGNGSLKGVAPGAKITAYKVLDSEGLGTFASIISGIDAAIETRNDADPDNDISIINLSLQSYCGGVYDSGCGPDDKLSKAVDKATARGIIVVVAAGNTTSGEAQSGSLTSPGTARTAITVGSVNKSKQMSSFSNKGPVIISGTNETVSKPDVVAPGESICAAKASAMSGSECYDSNHIILSGTSMAAPHVAGILALLKQQSPGMSPLNLKDLIRQKAVSLGLDQNTQGKGLVDASKLFDLTTPPISETPTPPDPETKPYKAIAFQDSYVSADQPNVNFKDSKKLKIDGNPKEIAYLKFDLTPLAGKRIISAKLLLKIPNADGSGSSNTFTLRKVDPGAWNEGTIKFNNKPNLGSAITNFKGKGIGNLIQVSVKDVVTASLGQKVSWAIVSEGSNELILNSKNAPANKPQILIQYQ